METSVTDDLRRLAADHLWIEANRDTLMSQYADQWIAVKDGQIIASNPDFSVLIAQLPDPPHTCVEFLGREPIEMIL
jgi:hypothetical protein